MRKNITDVCIVFGYLGSLFCLLWFYCQLGDPRKIFLVTQIPPTTAMVIGGVAIASLTLAWLVDRTKTEDGEEMAYSRLFHNRNRIQTGEEEAYERFHNRKIFIPPPKQPRI